MTGPFSPFLNDQRRSPLRLMVEIEGRTVPLDGCDWVLFKPCGCPCGVSAADSSIADEKAVWKDSYPIKRDRDRARRRGLRFELMSHDRCVAEVMPRMYSTYRCPHTPTLEAADD